MIAVVVRSAPQVCAVCADKRKVLQISTMNGKTRAQLVDCQHCQPPYTPIVEVFR